MNPSLEKQLFFLQHAVKGNLYVSVNTSKLGVILPDHLYLEPSVRLDIGLWLAQPTTDLDVNNDGIRVTLNFGGKPFRCSLPWAAVWLIVEANANSGCVWQLDAPQEVIMDPERQLGSTGSEHSVPRHRDAYVEQLKPAAKKKVQLPPGWGGIVKDNEKEPA